MSVDNRTPSSEPQEIADEALEQVEGGALMSQTTTETTARKDGAVKISGKDITVSDRDLRSNLTIP